MVMKPQVYIRSIIKNLEDSLDSMKKLHSTPLSSKHSEMVRVSKNYVRRSLKKIKELQRDLPVR